MTCGTQDCANGVKNGIHPRFLSLQPNKKWVGSILKTRDETKQEMGRLHPQNEGWNQPILLVPQPNTRLLTAPAAL